MNAAILGAKSYARDVLEGVNRKYRHNRTFLSNTSDVEGGVRAGIRLPGRMYGDE